MNVHTKSEQSRSNALRTGVVVLAGLAGLEVLTLFAFAVIMWFGYTGDDSDPSYAMAIGTAFLGCLSLVGTVVGIASLRRSEKIALGYAIGALVIATPPTFFYLLLALGALLT